MPRTKPYTVIARYTDEVDENGQVYCTVVDAARPSTAAHRAQSICRTDNLMPSRGPDLLDVVAVIEGEHSLWCPGDPI